MFDIDKNKYIITMRKGGECPNNSSGRVVLRLSPSKHETAMEILGQMMEHGVVVDWQLENRVDLNK